MKRFQNLKPSHSIPFWSWNNKLETKKLQKQIEWMAENEFGGFFMHARAGLKTEYLGDEWMECVNACVEKAEELGLDAWLYDENGWPSGFVGGELLKEEKNRENYLSAVFGEYDKNALVSYDISGSQLKRLNAPCDHENCLNIYLKTSVSTVDVLDDEVVDKFIEKTHEEYKRKLGKNNEKVVGFFTDEPQWYGRAIPFPHKLTAYFKERYGEDVLNGIGHLFVEKEGFRNFRYKFWTACQRLFLQNYAQKLYTYCEANGKKLTGHYIEERDLFAQMLFCGGVMPFYAYEQLPGIDWLCRRFMSVVPIKQLTSAAAQTGKKEMLSEMYAMTGYDVTPEELKAIAGFQYLYGITTTCQHLLPYSEEGERKRDYPCHFSPIVPWVATNIRDFNRYFNRLGAINRESMEFVNVAVLHPMRSAYLCYKHGDHNSTARLDDNLVQLSNDIARRGINFHYLDETILEEKGFVDGAKIGCGLCKYDYLIIPDCETMGMHAEALIKEYVKNGGKVYLAYGKPQYLEGEKYAYDYLESNVTISDIVAAQPYKIEAIGGNVFSCYKTFNDFSYILLINIDEKKQSVLNVQAKGALTEYDFFNDKESKTGARITVEPLEMKMLIVDGDKQAENGAPATVVELNGGPFKIVSCDDNAMLLDRVCYSLDGKQYSAEMPVIAVFDEMLKRRYDGDVYLRYSFEVNGSVGSIFLGSEYGDDAVTTVNGKETSFTDKTALDNTARLADIKKFIRVGKNEIVVKKRFYQDESVYFALFGDGVTEGLKNCLVYNTYFEQLYLFGDFGVYSKKPLLFGREFDCRLAEEFYIAERKTVINEMITDGYLFFAGKIVLNKKIVLEKADVCLRINGRIHYAKIYVNGHYTGQILFENVVDISSFAVVGENDITIEYYNGARNLLGSHHDARYEECTRITPFGFDFIGSWENGDSIYYRKSYAFVRQGPFAPDCRN